MKYLTLILTSWILAACGPTCAQRGGHIEYGEPSGYDFVSIDPDGNTEVQWIDTTPAYCVGAQEKEKK